MTFVNGILVGLAIGYIIYVIINTIGIVMCEKGPSNKFEWILIFTNIFVFIPVGIYGLCYRLHRYIIKKKRRKKCKMIRRNNDEFKTTLIEDNDTKKILAQCEDYSEALLLIRHTKRNLNIYELNLDTLEKTLIDKNFT